jgi:hypothetical protein
VLKVSYASRVGAGAHQQQRFEEGKRAWRRRVLPVVRLVLLLLAAPSIVYEFWVPSPTHFLAGFLLGALASCYVWTRDEVPTFVQRHADGAEGERATAKALRPLLKDGWHVRHDVDTGRGNRDHVLVGPGGVYLLDSKRLGGRISVSGDLVSVERGKDSRDWYKLDRLAGSLRGEAARLHDEILRDTRMWTWVTPVVVFWSPFEAAVAQGDKIAFIHGDHLAGWLQTRGTQLSASQVERVVQHIG